MLLVQKALLGLWKTDADSNDVDLSQPLAYIDRLRLRRPGNKLDLAPHVDGGSVGRWADPLYRYLQWERLTHP
jgi:hypothetical protein